MNNDKIPCLYKDSRDKGGTLLRQCQLVELHLLKVLDKICKENGISYFLCWGTLLGAVRHNGFIPWDDDLDVGMTAADFAKFLKVARRYLPDDVYMQAPGDDPRSGYKFAKLRDAYSFIYEAHHRISSDSYSGIFIDIFPFEDCPNISPWMRNKLTWLISAFYGHSLDNLHHVTDGNILKIPIFLIKAGFCKVMHALLRLVWWLLNKVVPSENVCHLIEFWDRRMHFPKKWIEVTELHQFEDDLYPIPKHAKEILTQIYGNWEIPLSPDKRIPHTYFIDPFHAARSKWARVYPKNKGDR